MARSLHLSEIIMHSCYWEKWLQTCMNVRQFEDGAH